MDVATPRDNIHAIGGACFVCQVRDKCMGVEGGGEVVCVSIDLFLLA